MACQNPSTIRNIGIIAHIDAGKTTLSERILFYCEKIHRLGEVHDGAATMDFMPEEQERGITIASACTTCHWNDCQINLVDTPGHVDFTIEVERCLRVLDGAIGVFCAVGGVEPQSETVWRQSEAFGVPKIAFINKMDRQGADFESVVNAIRDRLGANPVVLTAPLGSGDTFNGVMDIVAKEILYFDQSDQGRTVTKRPFTPDEADIAESLRDVMLEKLADADESFLALWMDGNFTESDIRKALRRAVANRAITPVFCGSALRNTGVQPLLDAIDLYLPSPQDAKPAKAEKPDGKTVEIKCDSNSYPMALVFKVVMEGARKNCFIRLYSGKIMEGDILVNAGRDKPDRIGRLYRLHADRREQLDELCAGDIAAVVGLADARTGDTYCQKGHIASLESIAAYAPVITLALEPRNADEGKILDDALNRYLQEDPTLKLVIDEDSGMRMLSGMGELHLEVLLERLGREYKIQPRAGQPQVVLRETVSANASARVNFDKELGKEHHQGEVEIEISARPRNSGNKVETGAFLPENQTEARKLLPPAFLQAVLDGINDSLQSGPLGGWPVVDVDVVITDIKKEDGVTTVPGLRMAAAHAFRDAFLKASPVNLEPLMDVEISTPEDYLGQALALLQQNGGKIEDLRDNAGSKQILAIAPLRRLFGFSTRLRSATQGRAGFFLTFRTFDLP